LSPADHEPAISTGPRRRIAWRRGPRTQGPLPAGTYAGRRQRATAGKSSGRRRRGDDATTTCGTLTAGAAP